jgi:hypothetical protein
MGATARVCDDAPPAIPLKYGEIAQEWFACRQHEHGSGPA